MNKTVKYILAIVAAIAAVIYLFFAFGFIGKKEKQTLCKEINVEITNSKDFEFINPQSIKAIILNADKTIMGKQLDSIDLYSLEKLLSKNSAIKSANVFTTIDGKLNAKIEQRKPILRVQCNNARFYIDEDGYMFPLITRTSPYIPIVTGNIKSPSENGFNGYIPKNAAGKFLQQLFDFAQFLGENNFWNDMVEQINIVDEDNVEIVPRIAQHIVVIGSLDNFESKLNKLYAFYREGMPYISWNKYKTVNIEYKNQIVCK